MDYVSCGESGGEKGGKKNWDAEIASSVIESRDDEL